MAQWIAISLTAVGLIYGLWQRSVRDAETRGVLGARIDYMKGEIIALQTNSTTEDERQAIARELDTRFKAHEAMDDLRFSTITHAIDIKLEAILQAVTSIRGGNGR